MSSLNIRFLFPLGPVFCNLESMAVIVGVVLFVCDNHYCMGDMEMEFAKIILTYTKRSINVSNRQTEIFS